MEDSQNNILKEDKKVEPNMLSRAISIRLLRKYNYTRNIIKYNNEKEKNKLFFGLELEFERDEEQENTTKEIMINVLNLMGDKFFHIMHDGSLSRGFELVSQPCSFNFHKNLNYEELFKFLKKNNYNNYNCGLHIHINRDYFGNTNDKVDENISKITYIISKFWDCFTVLSRRDANSYSKKINFRDSFLRTFAQSESGGKYCSVNLMHKNTIEFRMFKGVLNVYDLFESIEVINNLAKYCKNHTLEEVRKCSDFNEIIYYDKKYYIKRYCKNRKIEF